MFIMWRVVVLLAAVMGHSALSALSVANKTGKNVYVGLYEWFSTGAGKRLDGTKYVKIDAGGTGAVTIPAWKLFQNVVITGAYEGPDFLSSEQPLDKERLSIVSSQDKNVQFSVYPCGNAVTLVRDSACDQITIRNDARADVWIAIYYNLQGRLFRFRDAERIAVGERVPIMRPERKCASMTKAGICASFMDRELLVSNAQEAIVPELSKNALPSTVVVQPVGSMQGSSFFVREKNDALRVTTSLEEAVDLEKPVKEAAKNLVFSDLERVREEVAKLDYPLKNTVVRVEDSAQLTDGERAFMARREKIVRAAIEKKFPGRLSDQRPAPRIALCVSGGGCRAMIGVLSLLAEAEKHGLLPMVSSIATLSGSVWGLMGWMYSDESSPDAYVKSLQDQLEQHPARKASWDEIRSGLSWAEATKGRVGTIDLYGILLGSMLNLNTPRRFLGAELKKLSDATMPFPIITMATPALGTDIAAVRDQSKYYHMLAIDPYSAESLDEQKRIPAVALGRAFANGISIDSRPPLTVPYVMGICGSAMSISLDDIVRIGVGSMNEQAAKGLRSVFESNDFILSQAQQRSFFTSIPSFTHAGTMHVLDGGLVELIPTAPLLLSKRHVDMIVILDCGDSEPGVELQRAHDHAKRHGLLFPEVKSTAYALNMVKGDGGCSVHAPAVPGSAPIVVYLCLKRNPGSTTSFTYSKKEFNALSRRVRSLVHSSMPLIFEQVSAVVNA